MRKNGKSASFYVKILSVAFIAGLIPSIFNFVIDPYGRNGWFDLGIDRMSISEKAHYPLWKMLRYRPDEARLIVLGDSRARALRDKYWFESGRDDVFNFAYGGSTIQEIYETFNYVKDNPHLETLVVGIQLRSFDLDHKAGLNRVPEAVELSSSAFAYYSSWFVARISLRLLATELDVEEFSVSQWTPFLIGSAVAGPLGEVDNLTLLDLMSPEACFGCELPEPQQSGFVIGPGINLGLGRGMGEWARLWPEIDLTRDLPEKFERQIERNARSDWRSFNFSEELWAKIAEISFWCDQNDVDLIFVIPPTISEMQGKVTEFGFGVLNNDFRLRLSELAPVVDFDFDNHLTRDVTRFSDAYHFNSAAGREIVEELVQFTSSDDVLIEASRARRGSVVCPIFEMDRQAQFSDDIIRMEQGIGCRIWTREGA